jgi:large subunit ribosomal protein L25
MFMGVVENFKAPGTGKPAGNIDGINEVRSITMQQKTLNGQFRTEFSKGINRRMRIDGRIPSVIYGRKEPVHVAINAHEFNTKFKVISENIIIKLDIDKNSYQVLVKDFQSDILTGKILHIDFYEIEEGKALRTRIPVHTHGIPMGVKEGGIFEILMHEIEVECLPKDIPESVELTVDELLLGKALHIKDIPEMAGVKIITPAEQAVCQVTRKREEKVEEKPAEVLEGEEAAEGAEGAEKAEAGAAGADKGKKEDSKD